jgi:hypothetical protein
MMKRKERRKIDGCSLDDGAGGGNRTLTPRGERDFESRASTNFATPAKGKSKIAEAFSQKK